MQNLLVNQDFSGVQDALIQLSVQEQQSKENVLRDNGNQRGKTSNTGAQMSTLSADTLTVRLSHAALDDINTRVVKPKPKQ